MKKIIFWVITASLMMISCSKDEVGEINKNSCINFRASVQESRAMEITTSNLDKIYVTARMEGADSNYFTDIEFTKQPDNRHFTSLNSYFWPGDNRQIEFYAYWPSAAKLGVGGTNTTTLTINDTKKKLENFTPNADISKQVDFITANATGRKSDNETSGVPLTFGHRLSMIEVRAKNENTAYTINVKGVRIAQAVSKGTFDFAPASGASPWTLDTTKTNYTIKYDTPRTLDSASVSLMDTTAAMLIPQQLTAWDTTGDKNNDNKGAFLSVLVNIETKDTGMVYPLRGQSYHNYTAVPISTKWEAGRKYLYTFDFSKDAGNVSPERDKTDSFTSGDLILGGPIPSYLKATR